MRAQAIEPPVSTTNNPEPRPNGATVEDARRLAAQITRRRGKTYEQIERLFIDYLHDVKGLGIVSALLVGSRVHGPGAYLWNVFAEDFCPEQWSAPAFVTLNKLTYGLEEHLPRNRSLYIAHVNPSDVDEIRASCTRQGIETDLVPIR